MGQTGGLPVLIKYVKKGLLSSICLLSIGHPALACFPGYQEYLNAIEYGINAPSFYLIKHNGKSYAQLQAYNAAKYRFDLQLAPLPVDGYQLIQMGRGLSNFTSNRLGLYPLKEDTIQGFVLLERTFGLDICEYQVEIQQDLQGKQRIDNYLPNLPVPAGLELQFYEETKGKFVERLALLVNPNKDFTQPPHQSGRYIVMKSRYRVELEPFLKPEIQRYFEHNLPDWASHAEP